jgi:hypothetical protein
MKTYYVLLLLLPASAIVVFLLINRSRRSRPIGWVSRTWLLGMFFTVPYTFYVVRAGGDFMFARFLIPITPICFFLLESSIAALSRRGTVRVLIGLLVAAGSLLSLNQFDPGTMSISGIVDERAHYPAEKIDKAQSDGRMLRQSLGDLDVTVGFYGGMAMLMYYSGLPVAIECNAGLTDEYIAHLPLAERGRPGHEKKAPYDYLLERKVNFVFGNRLSTHLPCNELRSIRFGGLNACILVYENRVMEHLQKRDRIGFAHFPTYLDEYIEGIQSSPDSRLTQDTLFFREYYFDHNDDPARSAALFGR